MNLKRKRICIKASNALILILLISFVKLGHSQTNQLTTEHIKNEYGKIFEIAIQPAGTNECYYFPNGLERDLPIEHFMFDFINKYFHALTILQCHYTEAGDFKKFNNYFKKFGCNEVDIKYNYIQDLKEDKLFNPQFLTLLNNYLEEKGGGISDFEPLPKTEIEIDSLMCIASRFFDIAILENAEVKWLDAYWQNPYKGQEERLNGGNAPIIASFCFFAMQSESNKISNEILSQKNAIEERAKSQLTSTGGIERYTFFYNEFQKSMKKSEVLKDILIENYNQHKRELNFKLNY